MGQKLMNKGRKIPSRTSRFVLQRSGSQTYFAYVPEQLSRAVLASFSLHLEKSAHALHYPCIGDPDSLGDVVAMERVGVGVLAAAEHLAGHRLTKRSLIKANALVLAQRKSSLRNGPMWVGASNPMHAWYVAPPANKVEALVMNLVEFNHSHDDLPILLRACASMCQLLLVHPFADGNGRTARALLLGMMLPEFKCRSTLFYLLDRLWEFQGSALHAATIKLRETGSWDEFFALCDRIISQATCNVAFRRD
jgi:hypothetical protein